MQNTLLIAFLEHCMVAPVGGFINLHFKTLLSKGSSYNLSISTFNWLAKHMNKKKECIAEFATRQIAA